MLLTMIEKNIFFEEYMGFVKNPIHFTLIIGKAFNRISACKQLYTHIPFCDEIVNHVGRAYIGFLFIGRGPS